MEILLVIQNWSYTIIDLFLFIYCIIRIRNHGVRYFAFGFGVLLTTSLMWRLVEILDLPSNYSKIYEFIGFFNLFTYFIFAGLIVAGISHVSSSTYIHKGEGLQDNKSGNLSLTQIIFSFTGRIGRGTFWAIWCSMMGVSLIIGLVIGGIAGSGPDGEVTAIVVYFLYLIPCVWIGLAMQVKRWHDRDKSGWMVLINFIPVLGLIWALVELGFLQGTIGPNQYGDDPLQSIEKYSEEVAL